MIAAADGGGGRADGFQVMMADLLDRTLNLQASGVIDSDSAKLKTAHDRYAAAETSLTQPCTEINDPSKIG